MTVAPRSRKGVSGDQKGPRIVEEVGSRPLSVTILWLTSSTRLGKKAGKIPKCQLHNSSTVRFF